MELSKSINKTWVVITCQKSWVVFLVACTIFSIFGFKNLGLPGLYMDSVNPDYIAAWVQRKSLIIPAWIYPDNWLAGIYKAPLLNSLYGGNSTAYLAVIFSMIFGFGSVEVRLFHSLLGVSVLLSMCWCLLKWRIPKPAVVLFASLLASDPSFVYAWRTQYYLQLYPLIWFFLGLGCLGIIFVNGESYSKRARHFNAAIAGVFIGFAAYSYFIFLIYSLSVAFIVYLAARKSEIRLCLWLILGMVIGFSPYIYAHASIALNAGLSFYIDQIKGLQTAYGVIDPNQGGFFGRLETVASRLSGLVFGRGIEETIFGTSGSPAFSFAIAISFVILFLLPYRFNILRSNQSSKKVYGLDCSSKSNLLAVLSFGCLLVHLLFGVSIGKPLGIQHFIMILPLVYFACAILYSKNNLLKCCNPVVNIIKSMQLIFAACILTMNILSTHRLSNRLILEGGNGFYSDAINMAGLYLGGLPVETALLFPQWGYWMGVVTITGPRYSIFATKNLDEMELKLKSDSDLKGRNSFVLFLGREYSQSDEKSGDLEDFSERNGLLLKEVTTIRGRNNVDEIKLLHLVRWTS